MEGEDDGVKGLLYPEGNVVVPVLRMLHTNNKLYPAVAIFKRAE